MTQWKILESPLVWNVHRATFDVLFGIYKNRFVQLSKWGILKPGLSVIDIGCGIGQYSQLIDGPYLGIDLDEKYIDYCKRKFKDNKNKQFRCADASSILKEKSTFDLVLMVDILHHLPDDLVIRILKTVSLLSNAHIVNFEPVLNQSNVIAQWLIDHDRGNYMRSKENLLELYDRAHLKINDCTDLMLGPIKTVAILI